MQKGGGGSEVAVCRLGACRGSGPYGRGAGIGAEPGWVQGPVWHGAVGLGVGPCVARSLLAGAEPL